MKNTLKSKFSPSATRLLIGAVLHRFAEAFYDFAMPLLVLVITNSPWLMATTFIAGYAAEIIASPIAGQLAGSVERKKLLTLVVCTETSVIFSMLMFSSIGVLSGIVLVVHAALLDFFVRIYLIVDMEYLPNLVPKNRLAEANGIIQIGTSISQITAPALAGFLVYITGINGVLLTSVCVFVLLLVLVLGIQSNPITKSVNFKTSIFYQIIDPLKSTINSIPTTWRALGRQNQGARMLVLWKAANDAIIAGPILFLPFYFVSFRNTPESSFGVVAAMMATGGLIAGFAFNRVFTVDRTWKLFAFSSIGMAISFAMLSIFVNWIVAGISLMLFSFTMVIGGRAWIVYIQTTISNDLLGKTLGLSQLLSSLSGVISCACFAIFSQLSIIDWGIISAATILLVCCLGFMHSYKRYYYQKNTVA